MDIKWVRCAVAAGLCVGTGNVLAAPDYASVALSDGVRATPALDLESRYDSNIFQTEDDEEDSIVTVVSPALSLEAGDGLEGLNGLGLSYSGAYGFYESSSDDNYEDHTFSLEGQMGRGFTSISGYGALALGHDARGTGPSNGLGNISTSVFDEPTEYERYDWGTEVTFDGGGPAEIVLGYDGTDIEYQNFRAFTRARDRRSDAFKVRLAYELTGKTSGVLEARNTQFRYDFTPVGQSELDSDETRIEGGLEWEATARTTGRVTVGWKDKSFDAASRGDESGLTWGASVAWAPKTYSTFNFGTENGFRETDNEGDVIETTSYNAGWIYSSSERVEWNTAISYTSEDYEGATSGREDDFLSFNAGVDYDWRRWMTLGAGVNLSTRDSNVSRADYDRNQIFVRAMMSL